MNVFYLRPFCINIRLGNTEIAERGYSVQFIFREKVVSQETHTLTSSNRSA